MVRISREHLGRGGLTDEQARHLDREHDRDHHEQDPDRQAARGVPARFVQHLRQHDAHEREPEAHQRTDVLEHHDRQLRDLRAPHELAGSIGPARSPRLSWRAVRSENDSRPALTSSTTIATAGSSITWGCRSFSTPSKIANNPPTLNSTSATTKAQK